MKNKSSYIIIVLVCLLGVLGYGYYSEKKKADLSTYINNINAREILKICQLEQKRVDKSFSDEMNENPELTRQYRYRGINLKKKADSICLILDQNDLKNENGGAIAKKQLEEFIAYSESLLSINYRTFLSDYKQEYSSGAKFIFNSENGSLIEMVKIKIRAIELQASEELFKSRNRFFCGFNPIQAIVIGDKPVIRLGEKYQARIFLGQCDYKDKYFVKVGNTPVLVEDGLAKYSFTPTSSGIHSYSGKVELYPPSGEIKIYPFESSYYVIP